MGRYVLELGVHGCGNYEFCIKIEKFCIKNEEFCIKNDAFCSGHDTTLSLRSIQVVGARKLEVEVRAYAPSALYIYMPALDRPRTMICRYRTAGR